MAWFRHKYMVAGAQQMLRCNRHISLGEINTPITEVLFVCQSCGKTMTQTLVGHWTLDQLQPRPMGVTADREFFRKLGVKL